MRRVLKVLHTLAACGLIGGLGCYMIVLAVAPQDTPEAYATLREAIAAISRYVLIPSLAIALISGVFSLSIHHPFHDKGWVWVKAVMGIAMFEGTLVIIGARARDAATVARDIADGAAVAERLDAAIANEWAGLIAIMTLSVANVVLGVWRPRLARSTRATPADAGTATAETPDAPRRIGDAA